MGYQSKGSALSVVNPDNIILMFLNCSLWLGYAALLPLPPAVVVNAVGVPVSVFYLVVCWGYAFRARPAPPIWGRRAAKYTLGAVICVLLAVGYVVTSPTGVGHVGALAMGINIALFGAPLSALAQVIKDRSSEL